MNHGWLKTRDAREYLSMGQKQFARELKSGAIKHVRLPSGHLRFHPDDLNAYMRRYEVCSSAKKEVKSAADMILRGI
jgi:hypothetical protein